MESSHLLKLVQSLGTNEKRYVTLYLSKHKDGNNLLKLYQIISSDPSITDSDIPALLKGTKLVDRLRQNKYTLCQSILDALHQHDLRNSPYARIVTLCHQSEILLNKGLSDLRNEILSKAGKMADQYQLPELKLEILRLQNSTVDDLSKTAKTVKDTRSITNIITQHARLTHLKNQIYQHVGINSGGRLTSIQSINLKKRFDLYQKLRFRNPAFFSGYYHYTVLLAYYRVVGEYSKTTICLMKLINLFKTSPEVLRIQFWKYKYLTVLGNLLSAGGINSLAPEETRQTLRFAYNEVKRIDYSGMYTSRTEVNILDLYIQRGEFREGDLFLKSIQDHIPQGLNVHWTLIMYSNIAMICFGLGNYSKALFWLNKVLNNTNRNLTDFPYTGEMQIFRLIVYYELKKYDTLDLELDSTTRYIEKRKKKFRMDRIILEYLKEMAVAQGKEELIKITEEARDKLLKISKNKAEARMIEYFDFISWFESKIENRSFAEIIREKFLLQNAQKSIFAGYI